MSRVLHFAPEYGISVRMMLNKHIEYVPVDLDPGRYIDVRATTYCDATNIGFRDKYFDIIICNHVLEHIPDDRRAMKELYRVLKPGGTAILQVPISSFLETTIEDPSVIDPRERERCFGQHDHVRLYGADYSARLGECGFAVEIFDPSFHWGSELVKKLRLNPREKIYIGRKTSS